MPRASTVAVSSRCVSRSLVACAKLRSRDLAARERINGRYTAKPRGARALHPHVAAPGFLLIVSICCYRGEGGHATNATTAPLRYSLQKGRDWGRDGPQLSPSKRI